MNAEKHFLVLDIDGVLVEAHGYRLACIDTINDFLLQMGQPFLSVDRTITDTYEVSGISCEWDMVPLTMAVFLNWYAELFGVDFSFDVFPPDTGNHIIKDNEIFNQMLLEKIAVFAKMLTPDQTAINAIYSGLCSSNGKELQALWNLPVRDRFFVNTLDPKCPFFAQLMDRLLGSRTYSSFYGLEAPLDCESYLETKDVVLISEYYRKLLPELPKNCVYPVVMTYRPSLLPDSDGNKSGQYFVNTPDGECALQLLGWTGSSVRMIGAGSLCYIEEKYHLRREHYVKPHPFHALASMLFGVCGDELLALENARILCEKDPSTGHSPVLQWLPFDEKIRLSVFEDSVSGIESTKKAAEVLRKWGYTCDVDLCGIRTTSGKNALLKKIGADLYHNVNEALDHVLRNDSDERRVYK